MPPDSASVVVDAACASRPQPGDVLRHHGRPPGRRRTARGARGDVAGDLAGVDSRRPTPSAACRTPGSVGHRRHAHRAGARRSLGHADRRTPAPCRRRARTGRWRRRPPASALSGCTSISTSMSAGISLTSCSSVLTSKNSRICSMIIHGGAAAAAHRAHRVHAAVERQAGDQADDALLRVGQRVDQLGQVVLEEALAVGREERDGWRRCRWCWWRRGRSSRSRRPG